LDGILKQRLVGALVLIALGVVFWPLIFTPPDVRNPLVMKPMPERPVVDMTPVSPPSIDREAVVSQLPPSPTVREEDQQSADAKTQLSSDGSETPVIFESLRQPEVAPSPEAAPRDEPLIDEAGLPIFWVLQVATLGSERRANEIVDALRDRGYKAFVSRYTRVDEALFRVQIGPNAQMDALARIKPEIDRVLSVDSQILRYTQ